jgi:hypothetical protein
MSKATSRIILTSLYLSAAALAFLPAASIAAEDAAKPADPVVEERAAVETPRAQSGMRVWIDPETGAIRQPTEAERKAVAERFSVDALLNKSSEGLLVITKPDGAKFIDLQGRFMHTLVVTITEDGTMLTRCFDHDHSSEATVSAPAREELPVR